MKTYKVYFYTRTQGTYKRVWTQAYKLVKAESEEDAIRRSRITKNLIGVELVEE